MANQMLQVDAKPAMKRFQIPIQEGEEGIGVIQWLRGIELEHQKINNNTYAISISNWT